jgi:hypothetical protein
MALFSIRKQINCQLRKSVRKVKILDLYLLTSIRNVLI